LIALVDADPDRLPRTRNFGVDYLAFSNLLVDPECPAGRVATLVYNIWATTDYMLACSTCNVERDSGLIEFRGELRFRCRN
jgi:hypothetical protein